MPRASRPAVGLALLAVALLLTPPAAAQECDCRAPLFPPRRSLQVTAGGALLQTSSINAHLAGSGYAALSRDAVAFGVAGSRSFGPLRLGLEWITFDAGPESTAGGLSARLEASSTAFTVGWDLRPRSRVSVVPTLAVGRSRLDLTLGDRNDTAPVATSPAPTFDEVVADPGASSRIAGKQWIFEPMLVVETLLTRDAAARRGIALGVRAGYRIAPNRPDWRYRGAATAGGPVDQATGPAVRITLGLGRR